MNLYCSSCQKIHSFTDSEIEKLVYGFQVAEYDAAISDKEDREWNEVICLEAMLNLAGDSEGYAEWINEGVLSARKELITLRGIK